MDLGKPDISLMKGGLSPVPEPSVLSERSQEGGVRHLEPEMAHAVAAERNDAHHAATLDSAKSTAKPLVEYYAVNEKANQPLQKYTDNIVKTMLQSSIGAEDIKEVVTEYLENATHWTPDHPPPADDADPSTMNNLVHFLPADGQIDTIIILPAVNGKLERFDYLLTFLTTIGVISGVQDEIGTLQERVRVVFMSPFYGEPQTTQGANNNLALNYMFMKLKNANKEKVFYLADHTKDSLAAAASINRTVGHKGPLLSLLEPSHIRFTDPVGHFTEGILITSSNHGTVPERKTPIETYVSFTPSKDAHVNSEKCITVNTTDHTIITGAGGLGQCDTLLSEVDVSGMGNTIGLDRGDRIAVIRLLVPKDRQPLCKRKSILDGAPAFFAADIKSTVKAPKISIFYNDKLYRIRKPLGKVVSNWVAGVFTPGGAEFRGEADFLQDMGLSPKLLGDVFGDTWVERLTDFMKAVSVSKCFSDGGLLTYKECDRSRAFIRDIENYMMDNDTSMDFPPLVPTAPKTIPNTNGVSLDEVPPGGFSSEFQIGSHIVYPTLTGWAMPVMVINRSTNDYILRQLSVADTKATEDAVRGYLKMYQQQFPDWLFLT